MENKITRVELISCKNGREKVIKTDDITLSFQDDGMTLKIFYGYGKLDDLKHFTNNQKEVTKDNIIKFQDALVQLYETEKEGTIKFNLFRDSYKSTIQELKSQLQAMTKITEKEFKDYVFEYERIKGKLAKIIE